MTTPLFSLVHATARLPKGWMMAADSWAKKCDNPAAVEYVLCVDKGRESEIGDNTDHMWQAWGEFKFVVNEGRRTAVDAYNEAARHSTGDIIIMASDDYFPPQHWDTAIASAVDAVCRYDDEFVLDVDNQEGSDWLLPFSFLSRAYYNRLGCMFWPEYAGYGADNDFTYRARQDGVVIPARHIKFSHRMLPHDDAVYLHQRSFDGQPTLDRRQREGFPYSPALVEQCLNNRLAGVPG
jgi:hypothetical protein